MKQNNWLSMHESIPPLTNIGCILEPTGLLEDVSGMPLYGGTDATGFHVPVLGTDGGFYGLLEAPHPLCLAIYLVTLFTNPEDGSAANMHGCEMSTQTVEKCVRDKKKFTIGLQNWKVMEAKISRSMEF